MGPIDIAIDIAIWGGIAYGIVVLVRRLRRRNKATAD